MVTTHAPRAPRILRDDRLNGHALADTLRYIMQEAHIAFTNADATRPDHPRTRAYFESRGFAMLLLAQFLRDEGG